MSENKPSPGEPVDPSQDDPHQAQGDPDSTSIQPAVVPPAPSPASPGSVSGSPPGPPSATQGKGWAPKSLLVGGLIGFLAALLLIPMFLFAIRGFHHWGFDDRRGPWPEQRSGFRGDHFGPEFEQEMREHMEQRREWFEEQLEPDEPAPTSPTTHSES